MSSPQQVLNYLKTRGGTVALRELSHFPSAILDQLQRGQSIEVFGRAGNCEVLLRESKLKPLIEQSEVKHKKISSDKKHQSESLPKKNLKPGYKKVGVDRRKNRPALTKEAIFEIVKNSDTPLRAEDIHERYLPDMSPRAIHVHLSALGNQGRLFSVRQLSKKYWADAGKKHLLENFTTLSVGHRKSRDAVFTVLKTAKNALPVSMILAQMPKESRCSSPTVRDILDFFVTTNLVMSSIPGSLPPVHFALIENEQAFAHLKQLNENNREKRIIELLADGKEFYQGEISLYFGGGRCASNSLVKLLRQMESDGVLVSRKVSSNSRIYYSLKDKE